MMRTRLKASAPTRQRRRLAVLLMLGVAAGLVALVSSPSSPPGFFSPDSVWNRPLDASAPLDPSSLRLSARLVELVGQQETAHRGPWVNTNEYSVPVYTVSDSQATVPVRLDNDDPALQRAFDAVPLPASARPAGGTDAQMVVWQPGRDRMWEFWVLNRRPGGWHAQFGGAMEHVSSNPGYYSPAAWPGARSGWGASASSLPLIGGLMRLDELRRGRIDHALALALPEVRAGVFAWPAQRTDGDSSDPDSIPEGAHFRLDPSLNIDALHLPRFVRMLALAAQRYGIVVRDRSSTVAFFGEDPTPTGANPYPRIIGPGELDAQLGRFPWRRLELLRLDLRGPG